MKQDTHSSQGHTRHSLGPITCCVTKQATVHGRKWKSYPTACMNPTLWGSKSTTKKTMATNTNARKLDNMLLNKQGSAGETKEEIWRSQEASDTKDITIQSLWDAAKADRRGTFPAIQAYLSQQGKPPTNNLALRPKQPEKDKHKERHPNDQSRKERAAKKTIGKINAATTASLNTSTIWINP